MNGESLIEISNQTLLVAFIMLLVAIVPVGLSVTSKKEWTKRLGIGLTYSALLLQLTYFVLRWLAIGHAPVSNMYEFMTFFGIMLVTSSLLLYQLYKQMVLVLFSIPFSLIVMGFGGVFMSEASPLIPALQSNWLSIHVITVAFSSAILSIAFATGVIYLLCVLDVELKTVHTKSLEFVMYCLVILLGFIMSSFIFSNISDEKLIRFEGEEQKTVQVTYMLPAIIVNQNAVLVDVEQSIGLIEVPSFIDAKKVNTILWSLLIGSFLYLIIRKLTGKNIIQLLKPFTKRVNSRVMDEMSYRAVVIGFPLFSLGGLLFAMIWAHLAWGRFWGWDPKEVWALITWLFYAAFLHLRTSQGWEGKRTAWMSIVGFGLIVFNQVFVNLVISGLHSYA
ncbi:c-type cytochrome biogenesis protein CcsB [Sporosarcina sp. GW1-11]|uniref:c-type cytochrome biogenesis protein CcsB n=1 Tax=Sporosarcina sp. GW1-11 TaxID=2899126 RepID=UPI00294FD87A|nr:c-type cytochrome biogenesis protein CcsB [Sporosarcina sp. GW1-11]MDV6377857.1 c-type cytochrome biogenesis protein CcsB [Sporosarcina sp. GW1-11]